jgi:hypothetical protein
MGRISNIENNLKVNPDNVSTNDLIYYLIYNSKNTLLDANNLDNTRNYLQKINNSFYYENVFINTSNYTTISISIIGLLIPFYYFYPRFYKIGFIAFFIGLFSLFNLYSSVTSLYSNYYNNIYLVFIGLTIGFYLLFFVILNKLNHYSLLFISAIISFLLINYVMRIILTVPVKNPYNQFRATINDNTNYTEYNILIESTCFQVMKRFNLNLPSGNLLYSYLTIFDIQDNSSIIQDFLTNLFSPLISILILFILGHFLYKLTNKTISDKPIHLFPILGMDKNSTNLFCCQANYILPRELNVDLLIESLLIKYDFNDKVYNKIEKTLLRVSYELLKKCNPKFTLLDDIDKETIFKNLNDNKIYIRIKKYLKANKLFNSKYDSNFDYLQEIRKVIEENNYIPLEEKTNMFGLLNKIDDTLSINIKEIDYENDSILAKDELLYDKDIDEGIKPLLKTIVDDFIKSYMDNLKIKDGIFYGYDYNIITYSLFGKNKVSKYIKLYSNKIFAYILRLFSSWLILAKPIGSPLLIVRYIMTQTNGVKNLINNISENSIIWKYFSMGLDSSYFEEVYKEIKNNKEESILTKGLNIIYTALIFILLFPIFYMYNSVNFGLTLSPSWYNLLYQFVFILNIIGNYYTYNTEGSILLFNVKFLIAFIVIFLLIYIVSYAISTIKK